METLILRSAEEDGVSCPDVRALAVAAGTTTVVVRGMIRGLVHAGRLLSLGGAVYGLPGTPAATLADSPDGQPSPRTPPHSTLHEGRGSSALW